MSNPLQFRSSGVNPLYMPSDWGFIVRGVLAATGVLSVSGAGYVIWTNVVRLWKSGNSQQRIVNSSVVTQRRKGDHL